MRLDPAFLTTPLAHRGLHDLDAGVPENSPTGFRAAIAQGYGIELDLQGSLDGQAMVFHDNDLDRLTGASGPVHGKTAAELGQIRLRGGQDFIPTLTEFLDLVGGRVPLLIEIKDQDGRLGPSTGRLEAATVRALQNYGGPFAVMSFNPHAIEHVHRLAPGMTVGLSTCDFAEDRWDHIEAARRAELADIPDLERLSAAFISHDRADLGSKRVAEIKRSGLPVLCWTVKSEQQETAARRFADNITFEGYAAKM